MAIFVAPELHPTISASLLACLSKVGFDSRPILLAPSEFGLRDQVFRHTAVRQHEFRAAISRWSQGHSSHRKDAFEKPSMTPRLNYSLTRNKIDVDPGDFVPAD